MLSLSIFHLVALWPHLYAVAAARPNTNYGLVRRGAEPALAVEPNTATSCSWWVDNRGDYICTEVLDLWGISLETFQKWNPSISSSCENFREGYSYCVEVAVTPATTTATAHSSLTSSSNTSKQVSTTTRAAATTTSKAAITTTTTKPPATTTTGNGIATPAPFLPGMVSNCDVFDLVKTGETCASIASIRGVTLSDFIKFNPGVKSDCTGLWLNYYVCVSIVGHTLNTLTTTTKPTTTSNGIATPAPFLPGMVPNCDVFDLVKTGETCATISAARGVTLSDFIKFNPGVKNDCTGLWLGYYVCVSTVGHSLNTATTTKPTAAGNGVKTPLPTQTGMVKTCDTFDLVKDGETCATISTARGITLANFLKWNPAVGSSCTNLWLGTYACVGLI